MATVKRGTLTKAPQWQKHLRDWKRIFWKKERKAAQRDIERTAPMNDSPTNDDTPYNSGHTLQAAQMARFVSDQFNSRLLGTRVCEQYPDVKDAADKIRNDLGKLYQMIALKLREDAQASTPE